ncbi:MAG: sulfotransferase family 2 domain-containing protein [Gammaproteobacteria bacterium]
MPCKQLFWLHIKKSAGVTTRALLRPHYVEVDRSKKPMTFIQATPEQYNDILNNYRVVLGDYQFRRALFAKTFLYAGEWEDIYSFAFSREPVDRCLSMFYYLFNRDSGFLYRAREACRNLLSRRRLVLSTSHAFDWFLDCAEQARASDSIYHPLGLHFTTHTAPMWEDITDLQGNVLLRGVFRLEALTEGINRAFEACGIHARAPSATEPLNRNRARGAYTPSRGQIRKIQTIYSKDFDLYESAWH